MSRWFEDFRWALSMMHARRWRRGLGFSSRIKFDNALRPPVRDGNVIAYPDAIYHAKSQDFARAMRAGREIFE